MPIHHHLLDKSPTDSERIRNRLADAHLGAKNCSAHTRWVEEEGSVADLGGNSAASSVA